MGHFPDVVLLLFDFYHIIQEMENQFHPTSFHWMSPMSLLMMILMNHLTGDSQILREGRVMSMDAKPNMYPILILPASNTFYFCHHLQPQNSQPYHTQSIIYHPSFIIDGNSQYRAYSIPHISIFPIFNRPPSPLCPPLNLSSDPVLKMTHAIRDIVQFKTYPTPCIFLGTKETALVDDNEAWREYEAEFGVPGISSSSTPPPITFHLQLQNQIQRDRIHLPPSILSWEWFQDKLWTYCCL